MPAARDVTALLPPSQSRVMTEWRLLPEETRPGPMQMALDAVAAETAGSGGPATARVYRWEPGTLSLGYRQRADTVDWEYCDREGIETTRRPTGGGGIYHDPRGDISYSIALPRAETPGDLRETYARLCAPLLDALDRLGVTAAFAEEARSSLYEPACYLRDVDPAHDVVAGGRKLSGNAMSRRADAVVQHGSLSYALDAERHLGVFADPGATPAEFEARVTSVREESGESRAAVVAALEAALGEWAGAEAGEWTDAELARARELVAERFGDDGWIRRR